MKTTKYFIAAFLFTTLMASANPVLVNTAQKVAETFYINKYSSTPELSLAYTERDANGQPIYYVFNVNTNKGFVIVTAEDAAHPIIGYSNEAAFVIPTQNTNAGFWFQSRKNEVIAIRAHNVTATTAINQEWASYTTASTNRRPSGRTLAAIVQPLCSTLWDQSPYYNMYCPGTGSNQAVTGCVATAMAQIMKYWNYPPLGSGLSCYNDETYAGFSENYGQLCAKYDTSHYAWSTMPNKVGDTNNEVAKLMYDCGVSVDMDYDPSGSGAQVIGSYPSAQYSYVHYFGYDASSIKGVWYSDYSEADWITLLQNELNRKRPMEYLGFDASAGGHTWVCDGYDSATQGFHMNWGWSGQDDGYYLVTALTPPPYNFDNNSGVLYGIMPPNSTLAVQQITDNNEISVYPNPSHGVYTFNVGAGNYQVTMYNVLGQQVYTSAITSGNNKVDISSQPKGVYIYRLITESGDPVSTGRLVLE